MVLRSSESERLVCFRLKPTSRIFAKELLGLGGFQRSAKLQVLPSDRTAPNHLPCSDSGVANDSLGNAFNFKLVKIG